MTGAIISAVIGVAFLVILNIVVFAYAHGKLTQRVKDLSITVNNHILTELQAINKRLDNIAERISHLEGRGSK